MSDEDTSQLDSFILDTQADVDLLVHNVSILFPESEQLQQLISEAWVDVVPRFEQVSLYLVGKMELEGLEERLEERGLTGTQLRLKLSVYRSRRSEFQNEWERFQDSPPEEQRQRRGFIGGIIRRLLSIIDRLLDSLKFIPGVEAIAEVKGVLEEVV